MTTFRTPLAAVFAAGSALLPVRAGLGDAHIANQASGQDLILSLAPGSGTGVHLTFLESLDQDKKAAVVPLSGPGGHTIKPGEIAVLSLGSATTVPASRDLRLERVGGGGSWTVHYRVKQEGERTVGEVDVAPGPDSKAFERLDPDLLVYWGAGKP